MHVGSVDQRASWSQSKKSTRDGWFQASISLTAISDSTEVILSILLCIHLIVSLSLSPFTINWMENDSKPLQNTFCGDVIND